MSEYTTEQLSDIAEKERSWNERITTAQRRGIAGDWPAYEAARLIRHELRKHLRAAQGGTIRSMETLDRLNKQLRTLQAEVQREDLPHFIDKTTGERL